MRLFYFVSLFLLIFIGCKTTETKKIVSDKTIYSGDSLREVRVPVGGFGTGNILIGGRGEIHEYEIFNHPHRDELRPYMTFFSLWAKQGDKPPVKRVLERELLSNYPNGFGVPRQQLAGIPRFKEANFSATYPNVDIDLIDTEVPLSTSLNVYNPLIPLDIENSSLPVAVFTWSFTNNTAEKVEASVCFNTLNPFKNLNYKADKPNHPVFNKVENFDNAKGVFFSNILDSNQVDFGNMYCMTNAEECDIQTAWYQGSWWDDSHVFWNDFSDDGRIENKPERHENKGKKESVASILVPFTLQPGESINIPYIISWYVPNNMPETGQAFGNKEAMHVAMKNYYAKPFNNAIDVAKYYLKNANVLREKTNSFCQIVDNSSFPEYVKNAVTSNLAILKSNIYTRATNGDVHSWEGLGDNMGCCAGNCTHVYNYAQTLAAIFPSMERNIRQTGFNTQTFSNGYQAFRTVFPIGDYAFKNIAADGQMGNIMRVYREWKFSGDNDWLATVWPNTKLALEYAWKGNKGLESEYPWMKNNSVPWDPNKEGVLRGDQHNTYDCNFYGPNMMTGALYLGALKACSEMAIAMEEPLKAAEYLAIYQNGKEVYDEELWNGNYYTQKVELIDGVHVKDSYVFPGKDLPNYQYGDGCLADQLLGQYLGFVSGMGYFIDEQKVKTTLKSIFDNNYISSFRDFENVQRNYALNDESGLVICTWPNGNREPIPFPYADEVWTGTEYQVAASLIYAGMADEGLEVVKAIRGRYAGYNRNPFAEIESGYYYGRALASWSVLQALSGYKYDGVEHTMTFSPKINNDNFSSFWSCGTAWGNFEQTAKEAKLKIEYGTLKLKTLEITLPGIQQVLLNDVSVDFKYEDGVLHFSSLLEMKAGEQLILK